MRYPIKKYFIKMGTYYEKPGKYTKKTRAC